MPLNADRLKMIMMALGPASPKIQEVVTNEADDWGILLDDGTQVHLSLREAPLRLELAAIVGTLPEGATDAAEAARMLLVFNLLSHETGGARMALSPDEGHVFLMIDVPESWADLPGLQAALESFARLAETCRGFLTDACRVGERDSMLNHLMRTV